jgi:hypothetical protein
MLTNLGQINFRNKHFHLKIFLYYFLFLFVQELMKNMFLLKKMVKNKCFFVNNKFEFYFIIWILFNLEFQNGESASLIGLIFNFLAEYLPLFWIHRQILKLK